jgi:chromosome partitioning protein
MSHNLSICNQKGGVGKTTTAINLSAYLANRGQRVLLVDLDPQGNATSGMGIDKSAIDQSTYSVLSGDSNVSEVLLNTSVTNLSLLPSGMDLTGAEIELVGRMAREFVLRKALKPCDALFDYIIIDCPPSLGLLTINGLVASNAVIVPVQCEFYALEGLSQLINTIDLVKNSLNTSLSIEGLLLTMADYRTNLTNEVISEVKSYARAHIFRTVIPRSIRLTEAPSHGKPIMLYDGHSIGAKYYDQLSQEIIEARQSSDRQIESPTNEPLLKSE